MRITVDRRKPYLPELDQETLLRRILELEQRVNLHGLAMENLVLAVAHGNRNTARSLQAGNNDTGKQGGTMGKKQKPKKEVKKKPGKGKKKSKLNVEF